MFCHKALLGFSNEECFNHFTTIRKQYVERFNQPIAISAADPLGSSLTATTCTFFPDHFVADPNFFEELFGRTESNERGWA